MRISTSIQPVAKTDNLLINKYLAINYILITNYKQIQTFALINFGTSDHSFINHLFVYKDSIFLIFLNTYQTLKAFNSTLSDYRQIIYITKIDNFALDYIKKQIIFLYVTYLYHHIIILQQF